MDHTTFPIPAPARYFLIGSSGSVVDIQALPYHLMDKLDSSLSLLQQRADRFG
jgi:hypothetical protein